MRNLLTFAAVALSLSGCGRSSPNPQPVKPAAARPAPVAFDPAAAWATIDDQSRPVGDRLADLHRPYRMRVQVESFYGDDPVCRVVGVNATEHRVQMKLPAGTRPGEEWEVEAELVPESTRHPLPIDKAYSLRTKLKLWLFQPPTVTQPARP